MKVAHESEDFLGYRDLRQGLIDWTSKYNLISSTEFYTQLALYSLANYFEDTLEIEREKRSRVAKSFAGKYGISMEQYWTRFKNKPYEETISLSDAIYLENEYEDDALAESFGQELDAIQNDFFDAAMPFIFAPNRLSLFLSQGNLDTPYYFEEIKDYDSRKTHMLKQMMAGQSFEDYEPRDWFSGKGWDPRSETWKEFEDQIDNWFVAYKKMYRGRSEKLLEKQGYVRSKGKRNQDHFKWLVRYQIQNLSLKEIANYYSSEAETLSEDAIWRGVKSTAEIVHLQLRLPNKPGRPKNNI